MAAVVVHEFGPESLERPHDLEQDRIDRKPEVGRIRSSDRWHTPVVGDLVEVASIDLLASIVEAPGVDVNRQVMFVTHELHHRDLIEQSPLAFVGINAFHLLVSEVSQIGHVRYLSLNPDGLSTTTDPCHQ